MVRQVENYRGKNQAIIKWEQCYLKLDKEMLGKERKGEVGLFGAIDYYQK